MRLLYAFFLTFLLMACSTTSHLPEDDQLYIGLTNIKYEAYEKNAHFEETQVELEAALATAPNGSLFGSSRYRLPIPIGLVIWNSTADAKTKLGRWVNRVFGKKPVLMSQVNPALHASVANSVLRKNGYFHGNVTYETLTQKNPKKAKIAYTVHVDSLFLIDSMAYVGFPQQMQQLIDSTADESYLQRGMPLSVSNLDAERNRIASLFRNNGYYYYDPDVASFLADTLQTPFRAQLRLQLADSLSSKVLKPWRIGKMNMKLLRYFNERTDNVIDTFITIQYGGRKPPLNPRVILRNMKMRPRSLYSISNYQESVEKLNATNIFSSVDLQLTSHEPDILDQQLVCILDKPYDYYIEANFINRTIGRLGPELKIGFVKRNAFRGGERLDINLHGSNEWQTSGGSKNTSFQYGADISLEFPRTLAPRLRKRNRLPDRTLQNRPPQRRRRRFFSTPWTIAKVSSDVVRRPDYYKMHIVTGEWTYRWQVTETSRHEFSPLTVKYQFLNSHTELFDSLVSETPYLMAAMDDRFIPKMRYTYTYTSPKTCLNPIRLETTIEEAGNMVDLYDWLVQGYDWNEKDKKMFKNPYSQYLRLETDFTKTWHISTRSRLVGHINTGIIYSYGNSQANDAPFSECFYAGGANSIRAFPVRSIGPGNFPGFGDKQFSYLMQNGNMKLIGNLEWRFHLAGSLDGALFFDAGNVWMLKKVKVNGDGTEEGDLIALIINALFEDTNFQPRNLFKQTATGTGIGLRYDLDFLVVRVDWGFGLHLPYDTGKNGYFNIPRFGDMHSLHLAVGYPF